MGINAIARHQRRISTINGEAYPIMLMALLLGTSRNITARLTRAKQNITTVPMAWKRRNMP
jgi:hypothetical protein